MEPVGVIENDQQQQPPGATQLEYARRIRELRQACGLSMADLAKAMDLTVSAIKQLEGGRNTKQWAQLARLCEILGVTPNQMLGVDQAEGGGPANEFTAALLEAFKGILTEDGYEEWQTETLSQIALDAAREKQILGVDRRLAAKTGAVLRYRQAADKLKKPR